MRVMLDTNILISALVFKSNHLTKVIEKASNEHTLVLCSYVVNEFYTVIKRKFPRQINAINKFLSQLSFEFVPSPKIIESKNQFYIRDENDYIILHTAIVEKLTF